MDEWELENNPTSLIKWNLVDNAMQVNKAVGDIQTKRKFMDFQLHIEYQIPLNITGSGQARGNSGIFLASPGNGTNGYELQVLDNYQNTTYVNGQAGSIYKQTPHWPMPAANQENGRLMMSSGLLQDSMKTVL